MKNIVVFPSLSKFAVKLICYIPLRSTPRACRFLLAVNHFISFVKVTIIFFKTTSCVIISLTSSNFSNIFMCFSIIIYWLIKKVSTINLDIMVFYFYFWKIILNVMFYHFYFQKTTQKDYLLLEKLNQLSDLNIGFAHIFWL